MTARVVPLNSAEAGDPRMGGSADERVAAVAVLTRSAWELAGKPFPSYKRSTMPIVLSTLACHSSATD